MARASAGRRTASMHITLAGQQLATRPPNARKRRDFAMAVRRSLDGSAHSAGHVVLPARLAAGSTHGRTPVSTAFDGHVGEHPLEEGSANTTYAADPLKQLRSRTGADFGGLQGCRPKRRRKAPLLVWPTACSESALWIGFSATRHPPWSAGSALDSARHTGPPGLPRTGGTSSSPSRLLDGG